MGGWMERCGAPPHTPAGEAPPAPAARPADVPRGDPNSVRGKFFRKDGLTWEPCGLHRPRWSRRPLEVCFSERGFTFKARKPILHFTAW